MRWRHKIIDTRQISQKRHEEARYNHVRGALCDLVQRKPVS